MDAAVKRAYDAKLKASESSKREKGLMDELKGMKTALDTCKVRSGREISADLRRSPPISTDLRRVGRDDVCGRRV